MANLVPPSPSESDPDPLADSSTIFDDLPTPTARLSKEPTRSTSTDPPAQAQRTQDGQERRAGSTAEVTPKTKRKIMDFLRKPPPKARPPKSARLSDRTRDRVLTGRIRKHKKPLTMSLVADRDEDGGSKIKEAERAKEAARYDEMVEAKKDLFVGSEAWCEEEDRLYQILFMRDFSPLLPGHWAVDFRGIPAPLMLFNASDVAEPVIYSYSGYDRRATKALMRLIDLSTIVRAFVQTDQRSKIPKYIGTELKAYLRWAAQDGYTAGRAMQNNIFVDVVDLKLDREHGIPAYITRRMQYEAKAHRRFWNVNKGILLGKDGELPADQARFRAPPPVAYGLFVVNTTVFVLTVDASKGPERQVSYLVNVNFNSKNQGVWNAITMAIVVCVARDAMIARRKYFDSDSPEGSPGPEATPGKEPAPFSTPGPSGGGGKAMSTKNVWAGMGKPTKGSPGYFK